MRASRRDRTLTCWRRQTHLHTAWILKHQKLLLYSVEAQRSTWCPSSQVWWCLRAWICCQRPFSSLLVNVTLTQSWDNNPQRAASFKVEHFLACHSKHKLMLWIDQHALNVDVKSSTALLFIVIVVEIVRNIYRSFLVCLVWFMLHSLLS